MSFDDCRKDATSQAREDWQGAGWYTVMRGYGNEDYPTTWYDSMDDLACDVQIAMYVTLNGYLHVSADYQGNGLLPADVMDLDPLDFCEESANAVNSTDMCQEAWELYQDLLDSCEREDSEDFNSTLDRIQRFANAGGTFH